MSTSRGLKLENKPYDLKRSILAISDGEVNKMAEGTLRDSY